MNYHDPLTGLANRALFYDRAHKSLARAKRDQSSLAILLLNLRDLDKVINQAGRNGGDRFLRAIARNFLEDLRDTDTIARIGQDQFVVMLENISRDEDIRNIIDKLIESANAPVTISGQELRCQANVGVSTFPADGDTVDLLLRHADMAMCESRQQGGNTFNFYEIDTRYTAGNCLLLENDLQQAVKNGEFNLYFQPQIDLRSGKIGGVEALLRWQHPERGTISPDTFISLAEETGHIKELGAWVLTEACEKFHHWLRKDINLGRVAVNISPFQLHDKHFLESIESIVKNSCLAPEYLELEITESAAMQNAGETIAILENLNRLGFSISIDDFGTGYSSLAYLKNFPIQKLKIDRSFIQDVDRSAPDAAIAKSIIDLAHNLNLQVVAEGVEKPGQARWLRDRHCDLAQGDYYSKPLSEIDLFGFIRISASATKDGEIRLI